MSNEARQLSCKDASQILEFCSSGKSDLQVAKVLAAFEDRLIPEGVYNMYDWERMTEKYQRWLSTVERAFG